MIDMKEFNNKIKSNSSYSYIDFYRCLSETTYNLLRITNKYAKQETLNLLENIDDPNIKDDYYIDVKNCSSDITDSFNKIIECESDRLMSKINDIKQNVENNNYKKIITTSLPKSNEYVLYEKFFKPNLDILSICINYPYKDIIYEMLGYKTTFSGEELTGMETNIISLIDNIKSQIEKNKNILHKMSIDISSSDIKEIIELKNKYKSIIDGYKRCNIAYDEYISSIEFIIDEYIKTDLNKTNIIEKDIISPDNELEKSIENEEVYDTSNMNECFINIKNKINIMNVQLENFVIKYNLESLTESNNVNQSNRFITIVTKIRDFVVAIAKYIRENWRNFKLKVQIMFDKYGKWANKYENELIAKIDKVKSFQDTVCEWTWDGSMIRLSNLQNAVNVIIPNIIIGSPISAYEKALRTFDKHNNSGQTKENIYNTLMNKNLSTDAEKLGLNKKLTLEEKIHRIVSMYQKDPRKMNLNKSDVKRYISVLKNSKKLLTDLNNSDKMNEVNKISVELAKDMDKAKSGMNSGQYNPEECSIITKYYSARKTVLDVAKTAATDLYQINLTLIRKMVTEAYKILKNFLKKQDTNNESILLSSSDYIKLASLFEDSSELCMSSDLTKCGLLSKDANINDLIPSTMPPDISNKILELKMYPISVMKDGSILLRSDVDKNVWVYNYNDNTLICQNTLNSIIV